jgi:hypothetical protein
MIMNIRFLLLISVLCVFSFSSCEKDEEEKTTTSEEALKALEEYVLVNKLNDYPYLYLNSFL